MSHERSINSSIKTKTLGTLGEFHILRLHSKNKTKSKIKLSHDKFLKKNNALTIRYSILVGSLDITRKLILARSFPILCFKTDHKLVLGLSSEPIGSLARNC